MDTGLSGKVDETGEEGMIADTESGRGMRGLVRRRCMAGCLALAAIFGAGSPSVGLAQDAGTFPDRPLRIIVPLAPGGSVDLTARIVAEGMTKLLGQTVVIEKLLGGGGSVGASAAAQADSDGSTMVMGHSRNLGIKERKSTRLNYSQ